MVSSICAGVGDGSDVGLGVGVGVGVLVAACSSGDGPQADNKMHNRMKTNLSLNLLVINIMDLLMIAKWIIRI